MLGGVRRVPERVGGDKREECRRESDFKTHCMLVRNYQRINKN